MRKGFFVLLLAVMTVLFGYPYAGWVVNRALGTHSVVMTERDGTQRTLIMGPDATHPEWLAIMPGALVVSAGRWLPNPSQADEGDLEILTHAGFDDIRRFYMDGLQLQGFAMKDLGTGPLSPPAAAYLGIDGMLYGYRAETSFEISLDIRSESGLLLSSRLVQIHWRKTDHPQQPPGTSG